MIKFNLHNVVNTETGAKARVFYSLDNHVSGRKNVCIYGKTVLEDLFSVFGETATVVNNSDMMTDHFEDDRVRFFEGDKFYAEARATAERMQAKQAERWQKRNAA